MVAGLLVLNGSYLKPYSSVGGQAVLAIVFALFAVGLFWLQVMSRFQAPDRFLANPHGFRQFRRVEAGNPRVARP